MFKKLICLAMMFSFSVVLGSGDGEGFPFFKNSGLASIGPCRTMDPLENQIRRKAANTILEIYDVLNKKGRFPVVTQDTGKIIQEEFRVPTTWESIQVPSRIEGMKVPFVSPRSDVSLSKCVSDILEYQGVLVVECAISASLAKFSMLSAFYSDICINSIKSFLERDISNTFNPSYFEKLEKICSSYLFDELVQTDTIFDVQTGDYLYIKGHPKYSTVDYSRGENLYCVGFKENNPVFIGFGPLFADGPKTAEQIQHSLAEAYVPDQEALVDTLQEVKNQSFYLLKFSAGKIKESLTQPKVTQYKGN